MALGGKRYVSVWVCECVRKDPTYPHTHILTYSHLAFSIRRLYAMVRRFETQPCEEHMIVDHLENKERHPCGPAWQVAFDFLASLDSNAEEKRYELQGNDIYALVVSYDTRPPQTAQPEAHRTYIDIQLPLSGTEKIAWWPTGDLTTAEPYDPESDCALYDQPDMASATLDLIPGRFAVFYPDDAHMPALQAGDTPARVKKVVVKIAAKLLAD